MSNNNKNQKKPQVADPKKDQNIQSKLLGTNVSEINIEKFRSQSQQLPQFRLNGKLNTQILKTISGKFSPNVIFMLDLQNQNIPNIDALEECKNLVMLNLKQNNIRDLYPLKECKSLVYLNVSFNKISFLEALKDLQTLANLHVEENCIKTMKSLKGIENCQGLRTLYIKSLSGDHSNEICQDKDYRNQIFNFIPALRRLDGIPKNIELDNGENLVKKKDTKINLDLSATGAWFTKNFPKVEPVKEVQIQGEEELKQSLKDCKSIISTLEARMKALMI